MGLYTWIPNILVYMTISASFEAPISTYFSNPHFELSLREIILLSIDKVALGNASSPESEIYQVVHEMGNFIPNMYISQLTPSSFSKKLTRGVVNKLIKHKIITREFNEIRKAYCLKFTDLGQGELDFLIYKIASSDISYLIQRSA